MTTQTVIAASLRAFFEKYYIACHDAEKQKGKIRLDDLSFQIDDASPAELSQKVLGTLNSGEVPPEDKKQPSAAEKTAFLEHLSKQMVLSRTALDDAMLSHAKPEREVVRVESE